MLTHQRCAFPVLLQVVGMPETDAFNVMLQAHKNGLAQVGVWHGELAEAYCDQLKTRGIVSCDRVLYCYLLSALAAVLPDNTQTALQTVWFIAELSWTRVVAASSCLQ
jgi:ATP-dependent Clp protease adaptor protein ClpS